MREQRIRFSSDEKFGPGKFGVNDFELSGVPTQVTMPERARATRRRMQKQKSDVEPIVVSRPNLSPSARRTMRFAWANR